MAMLAVGSKMSGSEQVLVAPAGPFTLRPQGAVSMPEQSTRTREEVQARRAWLKAIVSALGKDATPAQIREQAYRDGFGSVNVTMLVTVRNELWPDRPKHGGGRFREMRPPSMASCPECGSVHTKASSRYISKAGVASRKHVCRGCGHTFRTTGQDAEPKRSRETSRIEAFTATHGDCTACKRNLPVECFGRRGGDGILLRSHCKECSNAKRAVHQLKATMAAYGLTVEDYDRILREQGSVCAICRTEDPGASGGRRRKSGVNNRRFAVDHCHKTNKVRGLLCNKCNLGIGNFNDEATRLEAAASYLRRNGGCAAVEEEGGDL